MNRDFILKWMMIAVTIATTAALIDSLGLEFPVDDLWSPLLIASLLGAAAWYYRLRGETNFVALLSALMFLTLYTACYSVMMYAGAALDRPLVDNTLVQFDALCGVHLPNIIAWTASHPNIELALQWAYNSLLWQTPLVITVLGFSGQLTPLRQFILQFMLGTWVCAVCLFLFPAAGPFTAFGYEMNATQTRYLLHFQELREGVRTVVTWRGAEGLITFPSFHTAWAMLLAWAVRKHKWLFAPSVLLNTAVIIATLTTGWHYFGDVVAGALLGVGIICLVHRLTPWLYLERFKCDTQIELRLSQLCELPPETAPQISQQLPNPVGPEAEPEAEPVLVE